MTKSTINTIKENKGILILIFGLLIILRNYILVNYLGYKTGLFYFGMNFVGLLAIVYGMYILLKKRQK